MDVKRRRCASGSSDAAPWGKVIGLVTYPDIYDGIRQVGAIAE